MKKIWDFVTSGLLLIALILTGIMVVPKLVGIEPMVVLSGSMEPAFPVGSMLYIKEIQPETIQVGDVITYQLTGETMVTHRVVAIDEQASALTTKGDANEVEDGAPVSFEAVKGKVQAHIPYLGFLADKLNSSAVKILYITGIVVLLILMYMGDIIWSKEEKENEVNSKKEKSDKGKSNKEKTNKNRDKNVGLTIDSSDNIVVDESMEESVNDKLAEK